MTVKKINKKKKMKVVCSEIVVSNVIVEIDNVPTRIKDGIHPERIEHSVVDYLIECNCDGRPIRAIHEGGMCGASMWGMIFTKKIQKELKLICKKEVKKELKKLPSKINVKKYKGWFDVR